MTTVHSSRSDLDDAHNPPAVDESVLDALMADLGDAGEGMRPMLWQSYLSEGAPLVARLVAAATAGDSATVRDSAHQLKSSSALLGARPLAALLQQAEDAGRAGSTGLASIAARVDVEYARVATVAAGLAQGGTP